MIFMSQSGLTDPARIGDWDAWYIEHLRIMLTVPGIRSAQRFKTESEGYSPSLALYSIAGPQVFEDPYYLSVRGMGEWLPFIDRRHYQRNLFSGLEDAPAVEAGQILLVADRGREDAGLAHLGITWLGCAGIDRSTPLRGIAVVDETTPLPAGVARYQPVTAHLRPAR